MTRPCKSIPLRKRFEGVLVFVLFALSAVPVSAQTDSSAVRSDRVQVPATKAAVVRDTVHSVRKATIMSAVLPGAGQVYNRKVWKVPVIYAAFAGMGYLVKFNHNQYRNYENALLLRFDNNPATVDVYKDQYSDENLRSLSNFYRRNRDLSIAGMVLIHVMNIIDAHVDAHLYNFDISDDLSMQLQPALTPFNGTFTPGLNLAFQFR